MLTKNDVNQISKLLDTKLEPIKKDIKVLKRDQGAVLDLLDKEQMQQRKRISRLEEHAGLPSPQ